MKIRILYITVFLLILLLPIFFFSDVNLTTKQPASVHRVHSVFSFIFFFNVHESTPLLSNMKLIALHATKSDSHLLQLTKVGNHKNYVVSSSELILYTSDFEYEKETSLFRKSESRIHRVKDEPSDCCSAMSCIELKKYASQLDIAWQWRDPSTEDDRDCLDDDHHALTITEHSSRYDVGSDVDVHDDHGKHRPQGPELFDDLADIFDNIVLSESDQRPADHVVPLEAKPNDLKRKGTEWTQENCFEESVSLKRHKLNPRIQSQPLISPYMHFPDSCGQSKICRKKILNFLDQIDQFSHFLKGQRLGPLKLRRKRLCTRWTPYPQHHTARLLHKVKQTEKSKTSYRP